MEEKSTDKAHYLMETDNPDYKHLADNPIVYFCAEFGIEDNLPIFAGGLGVLAGDMLLEAGSRGVPFIGVGLFYHRGFAVHIPGEDMMETPGEKLDPQTVGFEILQDDGGPLILNIAVDSRVISARVWTKKYGSAELFLLDTDLEKNTPEDQNITSYLYHHDLSIKLMQELVLGIGGVKLLRQLNVNPSIYHLNEGHTSFAALALSVEYLHDNENITSLAAASEDMREKIVATKHTILPGSGVFFNKNEFEGIVDKYLTNHGADYDEFFVLGRSDEDREWFSTTKFLMQSVIRANAVSFLHAAFERKAHPHSFLFGITNGANLARWRSKDWPQKPANEISDEELWEFKNNKRRALVEMVKDKTGFELDPDALTVVWARRFAAYKRPGILFEDMERLASLLNKQDQPIQLVMAGNAGYGNAENRKLLEDIMEKMGHKSLHGRAIYIPGYSLEIAHKLVEGADLWLSTPIRGKEASATSGMKAGMNGTLQFSVSDGWIEEVDWSDKGWVLPSEESGENLYNMLENDIRSAFYTRDNDIPKNWIARMRSTAKWVESNYTTERMLKDYIEKLYFPK